MALEELDAMIERLKAATDTLPTLVQVATADYALMGLRHLRRLMAPEGE